MKNILKSYISQDEILRYLKYKNQLISDEMQNLMDDVLKETLEVMSPKFILKRFPVKVDAPIIKLMSDNHSQLYELNSYNLCEVMEEAMFLVIGAVTLGYEVVRKINGLMLSSPTRAIIMDACASVIVDAFCDYLQDDLTNQIATTDLEKKMFVSQRYSPGYGDLNLEVQRVIADLLKTEKTLGVHLTNHFQLQPEKSVFFIIGLSKMPFKSKVKTCGNNCTACLLKNCPFREA